MRDPTIPTVAPCGGTDAGLLSYYDNVTIAQAVSLGELQQLTMLALARLGSDAYGAAIREELRGVASRTVSVPTVYVTLVRLEEQGLVDSSEAPREAGAAGRPRRVFRLTPEGWEALSVARASMARMWEGVVPP